MTKKCPRCNLVLDEAWFNWKIKGKQLAAYCKDCSRAYVKSHYDSHVEYYKKKAINRRTELKEKGLQFIVEYLNSHPCVDCGETDIVVLEFDHKDRSQKRTEISKMLHIGFQLDKLAQEMSKCEIRCANCHRRKTARENKSWKLSFV